MADENQPQEKTRVQESLAAAVAGGGTRGTRESGSGGSGARRFKMFLLLCIACVLVAAGAGYLAAWLAGRSAAQAAAAAEGPGNPLAGPSATEPAAAAEPENPKKAEGQKNDEYVYFDFEPIIINLDEPRLARYIRVSITLAVHPEHSLVVKEILDKKKPELRNWLTVFFASCTLEEVRGSANLNRLRREILDNFSQQLWPDSKPLISHVLFKEFAVS
jgi:flagellar basal body-associated protein FliL